MGHGPTNYLGIEIGGTKLQLGVGPGDGTLGGLWRGGVDLAAGPDGIRRQILATVPGLLQRSGLTRSQIGGVGIGFGGPVDDDTHTVIKSHQIQGWDHFPLSTWMANMLGWPAVLGNDSDAAGLAEALFGAGRGLDPIFYINVGSGIGGALILGGLIYRGCGRGAAEVGHLQMPGRQDAGWQALELTASGWAIQSKAREALQLLLTDKERQAQAREMPLFRLVEGDIKRITARVVGLAAEQGDTLATQVLDEAWTYLARAIQHVITLLCPRRIIIGGGVSLMGESSFFEPLRQKVSAGVFQPFADCVDIVPAELGEEVVVHGALALARRQFSQGS